jgi:tRNA (guanine26-N2/guanine27-N2)-dimethyltransferase
MVPGFLNLSQQVNRDVTISFLNTVKPTLYLDGFASTGIRAIRAIKEANVKTVACERSKIAFEILQQNARNNDCQMEIHNDTFESMVSRYRFDFIDVDPYGSILPFLDISLHYVKNGGYIGFTATDLSVLTGSLREKNLRKYGSCVLNNSFRHEMGIRNLLGFIGRRAANLDCGIEPQISIWNGHYYRTIVKVNKTVREAEDTLEKICNFNLHKSKDQIFEDVDFGPIWVGKLNALFETKKFSFPESISKENQDFFNSLRNEDLEIFFTDMSENFSRRKLNLMSMESVSTIAKNSGIDSYRTHFSTTGFKSSHPDELLKILLENK